MSLLRWTKWFNNVHNQHSLLRLHAGPLPNNGPLTQLQIEYLILLSSSQIDLYLSHFQNNYMIFLNQYNVLKNHIISLAMTITKHFSTPNLI